MALSHKVGSFVEPFSPRARLPNLPAIKGQYRVRLAEGSSDLVRSQKLRGLSFHGNAADPDMDPFDLVSDHLLVETLDCGALVAACRLSFAEASAIQNGYSGQFYNLERLANAACPGVELGRFCLHPEFRDPDILRLVWAAIAAYVDSHGARILFGCSSFEGTDPAVYEAAFALLRQRHLAPPAMRPERRGIPVVEFSHQAPHDPGQALQHLPPLLRTYLSMGGWVSDHAVVDPEMNTIHVFTGVEVAAIPPARKRILRSILN
ncbi:GNAT family N-acetyltransferase [Thalassococcus lentus]|uniref:L-ornithine N(alpha)-acyltransferase n=1 Tax=Thalassococcus lentus TaxID=1210524 RepID=A0ABT4XQE4_9RHOB|nr:GNAT family N-acyltransferase [Thalassococcus lentus]MDA7424165.1 GNAT family N-acetyltransferase [Thalassococcus lentus]